MPVPAFMLAGAFGGGAEVTGIMAAINVLKKVKKDKAEGMEAALDEIADLIKAKALYYCPIDTGDLRRSIKVEKKGRGDSYSIAISFGGPPAHYALYVHEDMAAYHAPPTSAKFLTRAVAESRGEIRQILINNLSGGGKYRLGATFQKFIGNQVV